MSKLKDVVSWFNPLTESHKDNELYISKYVSGTPGAGAIYEDRKLREQNIDVLNYSEVAISSAEILDLFANPKVLLPPPSVGKYYIIDLVIIEFTFGTVDYDITDVDFVYLDEIRAFINRNILDRGENTVTIIKNDSITRDETPISFQNIVLNERRFFLNSGGLNLTCGNGSPIDGDGTLLVKIWYKIETFGSNL